MTGMVGNVEKVERFAPHPQEERRAESCPSCQHFDCAVCHVFAKRLDIQPECCDRWQARVERDGMTIWEVITREG